MWRENTESIQTSNETYQEIGKEGLFIFDVEDGVSAVDHIERVLLESACGDVGDFEADSPPHFQLALGLIFQSQGDHVGGQIEPPYLDTVFSGHIESGSSRPAPDIENPLPRLKVQFLTKFLH